jgi:hypothetical protein
VFSCYLFIKWCDLAKNVVLLLTGRLLVKYLVSKCVKAMVADCFEALVSGITEIKPSSGKAMIWWSNCLLRMGIDRCLRLRLVNRKRDSDNVVLPYMLVPSVFRLLIKLFMACTTFRLM